MKFENSNIDIDTIPIIDSEYFNPLDKKYDSVLMIKSILFSLFIVVGYLIFYYLSPKGKISSNLHLGIIILLVSISIFNLLVTHLGFNKKKYKLRQHDLIYKTGLLWKSETSIPFVRVQHSEVIQGPIERMFHLAKLKLYTAGGHSSDLSVPGLKPQKAEELKDFITNRIQEEEE